MMAEEKGIIPIFAPAQVYPIGGGFQADIALTGDFNHDGLADIVAGEAGTGTGKAAGIF